MLPVTKLRLKKVNKCPKILQLVSKRSELRQAGFKQSFKGVLLPAEYLLTPESKFQSNLRIQVA